MRVYNDELRHFGVKGMKWGKRISSVKTYSKNKLKEHEEQKPFRRKTDAVNITREILTAMGTHIIQNKTGVSPNQAKILGMLSGELGAYTVGKALKLSNKDLAIESVGGATKKIVRGATEKVLENKTGLVGTQRLAVGMVAGNIAGEGVKKVLRR